MAISLGELATRFGCELAGDPAATVDHVASLAAASAGALSFLANPKLAEQLKSTTATAVVLRPDALQSAPTNSLVSDNPYATFARMAALLHPLPTLRAGVHAAASVSDSAVVSDSAEIAAHAVVADAATVGERVYVGPGVVVGERAVIADDCRLEANAVVAHDVQLGARTVIHAGAVIGADGFGNAMSDSGWVKVPQVGSVTIGSDVEIGANSTIDRGAIGDTLICDGVRIDNLCMIAHNVRIGAHTAIAAQTGIAGSAVIGERCMFAGQSGSVGHVTICDDVVVSGQGMITKNITQPGVYAGSFAAVPVSEWNKTVARLRRLGKLLSRVKNLESKTE